jgi:Tol biopolymer transport system component
MKKTISLILVLALTMSVNTAKADFIFGTPVNSGPTINSSSIDAGQSISVDGLSLYFSSNRSGGHGDYDIWMTQRLSKDSPWTEPVNLGSVVNSSAGEIVTCLSADGLSLYFCDWPSNRPGGYGGEDLWVTTRETIDGEWGIPVNLGSVVNSSSDDWDSNLSTDGLSLFFDSNRPGGQGDFDLWMTQRLSKDAPWAEPVNLGPTVNSSSLDIAPSISADGLILLFTSERPGGSGDWDLWMTRRETTQADWIESVNLGPAVNSSGPEGMPYISADGSAIYFFSNRPGGEGGYDLWRVSIEPVVDLNDDGIVDADDMCIIVDNWGTDNSLCDIGPMPWGDGIVDVQDLIVIAEHLFEETPRAEYILN